MAKRKSERQELATRSAREMDVVKRGMRHELPRLQMA